LCFKYNSIQKRFKETFKKVWAFNRFIIAWLILKIIALINTVVIADNVLSSLGINSDFKNIITEKRTTELKLFPNPANQSLTVGYISNEDGHSQLNIYNLSGQKVMNIENPSGKGLTYFTLNTTKLVPGFYILEIDNNGQRQHQKFLITR